MGVGALVAGQTRACAAPGSIIKSRRAWVANPRRRPLSAPFKTEAVVEHAFYGRPWSAKMTENSPFSLIFFAPNTRKRTSPQSVSSPIIVTKSNEEIFHVVFRERNLYIQTGRIRPLNNK